ncbi:MAG: redoxin domain-containing protein [Saprospiraceae bacterium]|nr:redoxin domain-containing protein [Saprospiraceae bacterium]
MYSLKIGEKAPGFTLISNEKKEVSLTDFANRNVVLLFFPFAFTGTCTKELCSIRDQMDFYAKSNAQILGISVDSPYSLNKYKEELNLPYPLLSDFNKSVSRSYDCLYEEFNFGLRGVSKRAAFVIDKEGLLRYIEILENAGNLPNFDAVNRTLDNLN